MFRSLYCYVYVCLLLCMFRSVYCYVYVCLLLCMFRSVYCYVYVCLLLCMFRSLYCYVYVCLLLCMFCSAYSVSLCCSVYMCTVLLSPCVNPNVVNKMYQYINVPHTHTSCRENHNIHFTSNDPPPPRKSRRVRDNPQNKVQPGRSHDNMAHAL